MTDYQQRVATEGELDEEELPAEVLESVEQGMSKEQAHFAVRQLHRAFLGFCVLCLDCSMIGQPTINVRVLNDHSEMIHSSVLFRTRCRAPFGRLVRGPAFALYVNAF